MWIILFFLLFSPVNTARAELEFPIPSNELATYMASFVKHSRGKIKLSDLADSKYNFTTLAWKPGEGGTIADCSSMLHTAPFTIRADLRYWRTIGFEDKWAILFHEWGHCACGLEHTTEKGEEWLAGIIAKAGVKVVHAHLFQDGCPDSIMYWRVPHKVCIVVHRDEYIEELFRKCKRPIRLAPLGSM